MDTIKFAVITDLHANLPALEAVLPAIRQAGAEAILHCGDAVGIGPFPSECLDVLAGLPNFYTVQGNHDIWLVEGLPHPRPEWMPENLIHHYQWEIAQIRPEQVEQVRRWPRQLSLDWAGVRLAMVHYARQGEDSFQNIVREPTPQQLDELFAPYPGDLLFYGHHHPFCDLSGRRRYLNPGSLGCFQAALARFTLVTLQAGRFQIEHRQVPYEDEPLYRAFEDRQVIEREFLYKTFLGGRFTSRS